MLVIVQDLIVEKVINAGSEIKLGIVVFTQKAHIAHM